MSAEILTFDLEIYSFQIDFNRHLSNIVYLQWMEIGRMKLLEAVGLPVHEAAASGILPILVESQLVHLKPFYLGESARAEVWLSELSRASAWIEFRFSKADGTLAATARQRGLFVHASTSRPARMPPEVRSSFLRFLHSPSP